MSPAICFWICTDCPKRLKGYPGKNKYIKIIPLYILLILILLTKYGINRTYICLWENYDEGKMKQL